MHPVPKAPQDRSPRLQHRPRTTDGSSSSFQVIHGYRVIRDIGQGAFATVYKVQRVDDDEIFAMKVFHKILDEKRKERFLAEIKFMKDKHHPSIMRQYEEVFFDIYLLLQY